MKKLSPLLTTLLILIGNSCILTTNNPETKLAFFDEIDPKQEIYIFGHKNPDLDSYASSFAYAELLNKKGFKAKAFALGEPNLETQTLLKKLGLPELPILKKLPSKVKAILVDHNDPAHSLDGLLPSQILEVVDHHRVTLRTKTALAFHTENIGSTASLIYKKFLSQKKAPSYESTTLLLGALLSDTKNLTSPATTQQDRKIAELLSKQSGEGIEKLGDELLTAKTQTDHMSAKELYSSDMKIYPLGNSKGSIGVVSVTNFEQILKRRQELLSYMKKFKEEKKLNFSALMITNLKMKDSLLLVAGENKLFEKAFSDSKQGKDYFLKSVISRKRQVIPKLETSL